MDKQPRCLARQFREPEYDQILLLPTCADWEGHHPDAELFDEETANYVVRVAMARHGEPSFKEPHGDGYVVWVHSGIIDGGRQYVRDIHPEY